MTDQVTYLAWAIGQSQYYRECDSVFACGGPYSTIAGAEPLMKHDLTIARQLVKESGYDGRPVVVLHVTDIPFLNAAAIVTRQRLESIGFKVILKAMDWSTNLVARTRKEPPDKGGWNLLFTWWLAADVINPAVHFGLSGAGPRAWFGWPDVPQLEKLITDWVRAGDETKRKQLASVGPESCSQRSDLRAVGGMVPTDGLPQERPRRAQVRSADFLEREGGVGRSKSWASLRPTSMLSCAPLVGLGSSAPFGSRRRVGPVCPSHQRTLSQAVETTEWCQHGGYQPTRIRSASSPVSRHW
jgi:hypothetical protein